MKVSVEKAQEDLESLIEKAIEGQEILVYLNDRDVVRLIPIENNIEETHEN